MSNCGVVVAADCRRSHEHGSIRAYVIDLEFLQSTGLPITRAVHEEAFRPPIDHRGRNQENEDWKNLERRYGKPLVFGDVISWDQRDLLEDGRSGMVICHFHRVTNGSLKIFTTRTHNGHGQILLEGVINPSDPAHLYTDYFRKIRIPPEHRHNAWPNIYYHVWIYLLANDSGDLEIKFGGFHGVCEPGKQLDVACVPWNKDNDKFNIIMYQSDSSDEEYGGLGYATNQKNHADHPDMEIFGREATITGDRTMIIWQLPQYKTVVPLRCAKLQPGRMYLVDAIWNNYEKMYMVSRITPSRRDELLPSNEDCLLRISVKENELMKGVFENETFGLIDDPSGVLSFLHLSKFAKNSIPVVISDGHPSRGGQFRFRIEDVHGDKKKKLMELRQSGPEVTNCGGVVLDHDWVFCGEHSPLFFKFGPMDSPPEPGARVKFSAVYIAEHQEFRITEWRVDPSKEPLKAVRLRMNPTNPDAEQFVFCVTGKPPNHHKKLNKMIFTEEFGLIDDNLEMIEFDPKAPSKSYTVWVTRAIYGPNDPHEHRTVFHVVGKGDATPLHRIEGPNADQSTQENIELQHAFQKIILASKHEKRIASPNDSVVSNRSDRFNAPTLTPNLASPSRQTASPHTDRFNAPTPSRDVFPPTEKPISLRSSAPSQQRGRFSAPVIDDDDGWTSVTSGRTTYPSNGPEDTTCGWTDNQSMASLRSEPLRRHAPATSGLFKTRPASVAPGKGTVVDFTSALDGFNDSASCAGSLLTCEGGIYPKMSKKVVEKYTGPVLMAPGSGAKTKYDVVETLSRVKHTFNHTTCGLACNPNCPWLAAIADLIVRHDQFWNEVQEYHPNIADTLIKAMEID